ncbi:putative methylaconitate Delta-isomerase PrpF [Oceanobacillus oncorhynchi subsp. incaldanensis]|uniref:3-methylitaconate isomerase n=1 Tax=Oceanobacillus oncorhynchi TaxID=545501 RepID=A0A0A1MFP4_9BACI|nr:PrpF domain-containing protein [Oceanobacillus oncorhynchi]UUI40477.1 PrpF protein [Oceanobacillus oncorhynchi]GIO18591.1 putative methylaconitate Delta-isomerase PrpF [Oceanobacillus oncorhynchi subsp. incaldanensis]CEI81898.1 3-methylitaconate isomerase [Oceanobacillus oncorhynchi]
MEQLTVPCVVYRGGTSRGLFFHEKDLPKEKELREKIFLKGIGAEDVSHVNGLGGGTSHTSKVVIINKSVKKDADIDYTFVQLGIGSEVIDYEGTCGNLMAATGAFAVDEGMINVSKDMESTLVTVWNVNIKKYLKITVPLENGKAKVDGSFEIPGVKDPGAKFLVDIKDPGGAKTKKTLPLSAKSILTISKKKYAYSFCDIVNPFVYLDAESLSLTGAEQNEEIMKDPLIMKTLEDMRGHIAVKSGLTPSLIEAEEKYLALPKVSFVSRPIDYLTSTGKRIKKNDYDILARMVSMKKMHRTFAVSGLLNLAGACLLDGTIPNQVSKIKPLENGQMVRIGHPEGIISIRVQKSQLEERINYVGLERTARRIMSGKLYIPQN